MRLPTLAFLLPFSALALGCSAPEVQPGITRPPDVYEDSGPAADGETVRAVFGLRIRDRGGLDALANELYDPASPSFHRFLAADGVANRFLPTTGDVEAAREWLSSHGLHVDFVAANRLMLEVSGPAPALNEALSTTLHAYHHREREQRVFGTPGGVQLPPESHLDALLTLDEVADGGTVVDPPALRAPPRPSPKIGYLPAQIARAYGTDALASAASSGRGITIALAIGGGFRSGDVRAFWAATEIDRAPALVREVVGPPSSRGLEGTMLVEWAGVLAPESDLVVYQGQDDRASSTLLAFNEAIARNEANVVAFSHSRHESSEPLATRAMFDLSAELGAIAGVTVVAASGDTAKPDIPATCPFVTAVGGTMLYLEKDIVREEAWGRSGSGLSSFPVPSWQRALPDTSGKRATPDVALNAGIPYAVFHRGAWKPAGGSSIAAPVFASIVALVDASRIGRGLPPVGFLNPALYREARVQQAFRDITTGGTRAHAAAAGWDFPTGWGAPDASTLAATLP